MHQVLSLEGAVKRMLNMLLLSDVYRVDGVVLAGHYLDKEDWKISLTYFHSTAFKVENIRATLIPAGTEDND